MRAFRLKAQDLTPYLRKALGVKAPSHPRSYSVPRGVKPLFTRSGGCVKVYVSAEYETKPGGKQRSKSAPNPAADAE